MHRSILAILCIALPTAARAAGPWDAAFTPLPAEARGSAPMVLVGAGEPSPDLAEAVEALTRALAADRKCGRVIPGSAELMTLDDKSIVEGSRKLAARIAILRLVSPRTARLLFYDPTGDLFASLTFQASAPSPAPEASATSTGPTVQASATPVEPTAQAPDMPETPSPSPLPRDASSATADSAGAPRTEQPASEAPPASPRKKNPSTSPGVANPRSSYKRESLSLDENGRPARGVGPHAQQLSWDEFYSTLDPEQARAYQNRRGVIRGMRWGGVGLFALGWIMSSGSSSGTNASQDTASMALMGLGAASFVTAFFIPNAHPDQATLNKALEEHNNRLRAPASVRLDAPEIKLESLAAAPLPGGAAVTAAISF